MIYVFDTNVFRHVFASYYREIFPSFWKEFEPLIRSGIVTSTSLVLKELERQRVEQGGFSWLQRQDNLFLAPIEQEGKFLRQIYDVEHFRQQNVGVRELYTGGDHADPYVIARAAILESTVVTQETYAEHAAKIPNICEHFSIPCLKLDGFMREQNWKF